MDWKVSLSAAAAFALASMGVHAATEVSAYKLDASFLQGKRSIHAGDPAASVNATVHGAAVAKVKAAMKSAKKGSGLPGIDSIANFTGQYTNTTGFPLGTWQYAMVGNAPNNGGGGSTRISAPIIPVTIELLDANGNQAYDTSNPNAPPVALILSPQDHVQPVLQSPVFSTARYTSSNTPTEYNDAVHRAQFWGEIGSGWHTLLEPSVKQGRVMKVPMGAYFYALNADGSCCAFFLIDDGTFGALLFPPVYPVDNSTVIGAAELAGDMTTKTIATLLFPDTYLYLGGDPNNCCVLGYHTFDFEPGTAANGNLPRFYVMNYSSWISPGLFGAGFEDVTALSHEMAEIFADPFVVFDGVHNASPWWSEGSQCQNDIEVGDVIESLPSDVTYSLTMRNGYTYHPQNVALLPFFAFQSPSSAIDGAYSYPDPAALRTLSPVVQPVFDKNGNLIACVPYP